MKNILTHILVTEEWQQLYIFLCVMQYTMKVYKSFFFEKMQRHCQMDSIPVDR